MKRIIPAITSQALTASVLALALTGCILKDDLEVRNDYSFPVVVYEDVPFSDKHIEVDYIGVASAKSATRFPRSLAPTNKRNQIEFRTESGIVLSQFTATEDKFKDHTLSIATGPKGNLVY